MIFGFNTDIRSGETVYHVQSEARQGEQLLQTQVFVQGRCIGKRAVSYAEKLKQPDFAEAQLEQSLREQHRMILDSIREGKLDNILDRRDTPESLAAIKQLDVHWINSADLPPGEEIILHLLVTDSGAAVSGAQLTSRLTRAQDPPHYQQEMTDHSGMAQMKVRLDDSGQPDAAILVQASYDGRTATRRFKLQRVEA
jgi:hypothetical protein